MTGIYIIKNLINNKCYVGQSNNIDSRWIKHKNALNHNYHINKHLQGAWNKYGKDNFEFKVLEECDRKELNYKEIYWIKTLESKEHGYNMDNGGDGITGFKHSSEEIEKMRRIKSPLIILQFDFNFNLINRWIGGSSHISKELKFTRACIDRCCQHLGKLISYKNFYWIYEKEYNLNEFSWDNYLLQISDFDYKYELNNNKMSNKKIVQYDFDRNILKIWDTLKDLKEAGFSRTNILDICNQRKNRKISGGFLWSYENYDFSDNYFNNIKSKNKNIINKRTRKIEKYDMQNNYICTYNSITEASNDIKGTCGNIVNVAKGNKLSYKKFKWKYTK